ncbi:glycosyltransferase family 4 protein, partial [bacterium]|nr:glycosyltransferase family 4 protein [bacterium]
MKKVLIIHPEGNINNNPNLSGIVRILCESGYRVDICSRKVKTIDQEFHCEGARLFLVNKKVSATDGFVILAGLSPDYKQRHHFIHETIGDYDLVVGVDRGIIEASEIAQVKRTPLGLISYEIYFVAEAGNDFKQPEIEACRNIDFAVCQDELRAGYLSVENRILLEKIINIPLGGRFVRKGSKSSYLYDSLGIEKNKKIALFAGSLGRWSMTDYLIETAKTWSNDWVLVLHNRYKLDEDTLTYYQERKGLSDNVHFSLEPVTDVSEVGRILHSANIGVALYQAQSNSIQEGNNLRYVGMASGKVATYLQHGLPVVVNDIGEMSDYVRKNNLGLVVDKNNPFKIDVKSGELIQWSENCYRFFEEKLDLNKTILPLLEKIQSLIGKDSTTTVFTFDSNKDRPQRQLLLNHNAGAESGSADKVDISLILCTKDRA